MLWITTYRCRLARIRPWWSDLVRVSRPPNLPDKLHFIGDAFPSSDVQRDVLRNATQIALIEKCGGPCGDDGWITIHSPQGEFNINLLTREFSVNQGDGSYFQGAAPSPGEQSVQAVSGNLPQQNLPKP